MDEGWLRRGGHHDVYVAAPSGDGDGAMPKWVTLGDVLVGKLTLDKKEKAVSTIPLVYDAPPHAIEPAKEKDGDEDDEDKGEKAEHEESKEAAKAQEDEENLSKSVLEASLKQLSSLRKSKASIARYEALSERLLADNPSHLPLLLELLAFSKTVPAPEGEEEAAWRATQVGEAAARILSSVDESALALYYGRARDDADAADRKAAKKEAKERGEQRTALRSALLARASAYAPAQITQGGTHKSESLDGRFKDSVAEMKAWLESADSAADDDEKDALAMALTKYELAMKRPGAALSLLRTRLGAQTAGSANGKAMLNDLSVLYRELGLDHWASNNEELAFRKFPVEKLPL